MKQQESAPATEDLDEMTECPDVVAEALVNKENSHSDGIDENAVSDGGDELTVSDVGAEGDAQFLVGDDDESVEEIAVSDIGTYGDLIIEELSLETNVKKFTRFTKVPEKVAKYILAVLYLAVGALCVAMPEGIEYALPYIVGGGMAAYALVQFVFAIVQKEYRNVHSNRTVSALIVGGLSVMIIIEHEWAHTFIPIVWGILGLFEGARAFNHAISRISRGMRSAYYIVKGIVEVAVAFLLLYRPEEYGELHIIVFGVSLIIDGITVMPFVEKLLTRQ